MSVGGRVIFGTRPSKINYHNNAIHHILLISSDVPRWSRVQVA